jgi:hypothetical protein
MELPVPVSLSSLAPILQLRAISAGFRNQPSQSEDDAPPAETPSSSLPPQSQPTTATTASTPGGKQVKVLGSKKVLKKATGAAAEETQGSSAVDVTKILDSITLDLEQNTKIAIVGKNGCGKRLVLTSAPHCCVTLLPFPFSSAVPQYSAEAHHSVWRKSSFVLELCPRDLWRDLQASQHEDRLLPTAPS